MLWGSAIEVLEPGAADADLVLINPAGGRILIEVKRLSLASADGLDRRIKQWSGQTSLEAAIGVLDGWAPRDRGHRVW